MTPRTDRSLRELAAAIHADQPLAFVGAGVSARLNYPDWAGLLDRMWAAVKERYPVDAAQETSDLLWQAEECRALLDTRYGSLILESFGPGARQPDAFMQDLVALPFRHFLTTNFDDMLERSHEKAFGTPARSVVWQNEEALRDFIFTVSERVADPASGRRYVHLHGIYNDLPSLVLTDRDYARQYRLSDVTPRKLFAILATQRVVFIGFSLTDPEFTELMRVVWRSMGEGRARHFAILAVKDGQDPMAIRRRLNGKYGVEPVFYPHTPDHRGLTEIVAALRAGPEAQPHPAREPQALPPPVSTGEFMREPPSTSQPPAPSSGRKLWPSFGLGRSRRPAGTPVPPAPAASRPSAAPAATPVASPSPPAPPAAPSSTDDPHKGRWGGLPERNGRVLRASVTPVARPGAWEWFQVRLEVGSTDSAASPLTGRVVFHLHPTFSPPDPGVDVVKGVAATSLLAWGAFTVGAEADQGATRLELDLALLPEAPEAFRAR